MSNATSESFGRPYLWQCEWARCPLTTPSDDDDPIADIPEGTGYHAKCATSWKCKEHEFHHLHDECAARLGMPIGD